MKRALVRTLPGRAIVIGLAFKLAVFLLRSVAGQTPALVAVVDTFASIAIAAGGVYFLVRGMALARQRLLWRVRRKLIISYIFIGFIPALLLVAFFLLGGVFLFSNFSSYLVQNRLQAFSDRAASFASAIAVEIQRAGGSDVGGILGEQQATLAREFPGVSLAIVPMTRSCASSSSGPAAESSSAPTGRVETAGPWAHVEPPGSIPSWLTCEGFSGLLAYAGERWPAGGAAIKAGGGAIDFSSARASLGVLIRAVAFPHSPNPGYGVVVDMPVVDALKGRLRTETGVDIAGFQPFTDEVTPLRHRGGGDVVGTDAAPTNALPLMSATFLEYRDWQNGNSGELVATTRLSIGEIYARISTQAFGSRRFSQGLLLILIIIGVLFLIIEALAFATGLALARSITGSVHELFAGTERVRQGDFTHKIAVAARDQLGELAESFNSMTASIEDLLRQAAEKKRLEEELRIAHEIQMSLLPQGPLRMPGLSVTALCVPAREVGGDYYDFLPLDDHRVGVLIADVSGKGTSAALYMAELKGLMLSLSRIHASPRELLIAANRIIGPHLDARSFITMTYGIIDLRAQTMTYARAGHTPLIYVPGPASESRRARILAPDGLVLGLKVDDGQMFERLLEEETIVLRSGDLYLFFTDGISEAMNAGDDCFGETRLGELIEAHAHLPTDELRERVLREIDAFVGDAPQHDDMTMILLKIEMIAAAEPPRAMHAEHAVASVGADLASAPGDLASAPGGASSAPTRSLVERRG